jgi:hypothetical protein
MEYEWKHWKSFIPRYFAKERRVLVIFLSAEICEVGSTYSEGFLTLAPDLPSSSSSSASSKRPLLVLLSLRPQLLFRLRSYACALQPYSALAVLSSGPPAAV